MTNYPYYASGLRAFPNLRYSSEPRLTDKLRSQLKVVPHAENSKKVVYTSLSGEEYSPTFSFTDEFTDREILASMDVEVWLAGLSGYRLNTTPRWELP